MKIILIKDALNLGKVGEIKEVKTGYFKNFLQPAGLAILATPRASAETKARLETKKAKEEAENLVKKDFLEKIKTSGLTITVKANKKGRLYNGVDKAEVCQAIKDDYAFEVDKDKIDFEEQTSHFKKLGEYKIKILGEEIDLRVAALLEHK